ncbi:MAG: hypothetical protein JW748_02050 [Anaerolineales bacterium]|nr:hypothetical protein [Anaerolineales bacterium]
MAKKKKSPFRPKSPNARAPEPMTELDSRPVSEAWDAEDWRSLQNKLMHFTMREKYFEPVQRAKQLFLRGTGDLEEDSPEIETFFEWSAKDFRMADGRSILDEFHRRCSGALPPGEREGLDFWIRHRGQRLWELREVKADGRLTVREILEGRDWTVNDPEVRQDARPWTIIFTRLSLKAGETAFFGPRYFLPPQTMTDIKTFAGALLKAWRPGHPRAEIGEFYRDRFLPLHREVRRLQEESSRRPQIRTPEGHELIFMAAEFALRDAQQGRAALDAAEEFSREEPPGPDPEVVSYVWLQRGRSLGLFTADSQNNIVGAMLSGLGAAPGEATVGDPGRLLGTVKIGGGELRLECFSRQRLDAGKRLLMELLGSLIQPKGRDIELDMDELVSQAEEPPAPSVLPPVALARVEKEIRDRVTANWLEMEIPALDMLTPRQAAKDPEARGKLEELLKQFEYMDAGRNNPHTMDLARIRRELKMKKGK